MDDLAKSPITQIGLPLAVGVGSAASPAGARGAQGLITTLALIQNQTQQRQFAQRQQELLELRRQESERPQTFLDQKSGQIITAPRGGGDISAQRIPGRVQAPTLAEVLGTQAGRPTPPGVEGFVPGVTEQQPAARPTVGGNLASLECSPHIIDELPCLLRAYTLFLYLILD